jgi:basic membrane protein A
VLHSYRRGSNILLAENHSPKEEKMKRTIFALIIVTLLLTMLTACGQTAQPAQTDKVVYLINGALGDNGFFDSGKIGMDAIASKYGVETRTIEAGYDSNKYEPSLQAAMDYADVIFVISYGFEDQLKAMADKYPNKVIVNLDTVVKNDKNTITSVDFIEEESAYLAGVTAALTTLDTSIPGVNADKVVGVVGGDVDPVISAFVYAYENGVHSVDPSITVLKKSLGGAWDDSSKGKQAALQLYDQGADVVFQAAGGAGLGVLQAARERSLYAIGADINQNDLEPGYVIASDVKYVGKGIEDNFAAIKDGTYKPGQVFNYGVKSGGVDLDFKAQKQSLPQSIIDQVNAIRQQIIDGSLKVELYNGQDVW